jgi:hypothetical protein
MARADVRCCLAAPFVGTLIPITSYIMINESRNSTQVSVLRTLVPRISLAPVHGVW